MRRMLQNQIGTSINYVGHAHVEHSASGGAMRQVIEDSGPGVPYGELDALLSPFSRGEISRNRKTGGCSLGLAISRAIARSHGCDIGLARRQPHGLRVAADLSVSPLAAGCAPDTCR